VLLAIKLVFRTECTPVCTKKDKSGRVEERMAYVEKGDRKLETQDEEKEGRNLKGRKNVESQKRMEKKYGRKKLEREGIYKHTCIKTYQRFSNCGASGPGGGASCLYDGHAYIERNTGAKTKDMFWQALCFVEV
jgi:hypothetical protein